MASRESHGRGLSIVCVFNNPQVRAECLDASIKASDGACEIQYIPIDNTRQTFTSAGAALNHGARQAAHEFLVFVHQDVYLHSIDRLVEAAEWLTRDDWGLLGACGITHDGVLTSVANAVGVDIPAFGSGSAGPAEVLR